MDELNLALRELDELLAQCTNRAQHVALVRIRGHVSAALARIPGPPAHEGSRPRSIP